MPISPDQGLLSDLGISVRLMLAGFCGGVAHAFVFRQTDPWSAVGSIIVGAVTANYLGPTASLYIGKIVNIAPPDGIEGGGAFVVGLTAMAICQGLVAAARRLRFGKEAGNGSKSA